MMRVDLQPIGRRADVPAGATVMEAAQTAGVELAAVCGGEGICGKCRVRLVHGSLSPLVDAEREWLSDAEIAAGMRLACLARLRGDARIDIPPESLTAAQRLQLEGDETPPELDSAFTTLDVQLPPASLNDLRSDVTRLRESLHILGVGEARFELPVLAGLSERLRAQGWAARVALNDGRVAGVLPAGARLLGLAVDVGTTKLAAYLVDLESGATLARAGAPNPQVAYGEDVVSRVAYAVQHQDGRRILQARLVERLNDLVEELCQAAGATRDAIVAAVLVGNTAMHHLLLGLPVRQLGEAPYLAALSDAIEARAQEIGLRLAPGASIYLPPNIAGYVGGDHVAMVLATGVQRTERVTIALDIGTNTEISLAAHGRLFSCSCASGPTFEGAHIRDGMRAAPGAVERVQMVDGEVRVQTVGSAAPVGICGSGILDAVAELRRMGVAEVSGRLRRGAPRVREAPGGGAFELVPAAASGHGRAIEVTRKDIHEVQLAKGAIRAGVETLLRVANVPAAAVEDFIIAGAFGTYLDLGSALAVGMFPALPRERFRQVGNAAGVGARRMLLARAARDEAESIATRAEYVELTTYAGFVDLFTEALALDYS